MRRGGWWVLGALGALSGLLWGAGCRQPSSRDAAGRPLPEKLYALHCSGCHGKDGRQGKPEMHLTNAARLSEEEVRATISQGRGQAMPAFKDRLQPDELQALVVYVRALGAGGVPVER